MTKAIEFALTAIVGIIVILGCALALCLYTLNGSDLWFDELPANQFTS